MKNLRIPEPDWAKALYERVKGMIDSLSQRISQQESAGYITQETDPTVPAWAKAAQKPTYTASEVGALSSSDVANNLTTTAAGKVLDARQGKTLKDLVDGKADASSIPTNTSDLTNDGDGNSPFATLNDIPSPQTVPTKTSDLTNDGDNGQNRFITSSDDMVTKISSAYKPFWIPRSGHVTLFLEDMGMKYDLYDIFSVNVPAGDNVMLKAGEMDITPGTIYSGFVPVGCAVEPSGTYADLLYVDINAYFLSSPNAYEIYVQIHNRSTTDKTFYNIAVRVLSHGTFPIPPT